MAKENNFLGVDYFAVGTPGDGVMGTLTTEFNDVEVGSVNIDGSSSTATTIPSEQNDSYITLNDAASAATVTARLYGVTPAELVILAGGSVDATVGSPTEGLWLAPQTLPDIYLSFRMEGKPINGRKGVLEMPYAQTVARLQGTATKNGLPAVEVTFTANTPEAADGTQGAPLHYGTVAVV